MKGARQEEVEIEARQKRNNSHAVEVPEEAQQRLERIFKTIIYKKFHKSKEI